MRMNAQTARIEAGSVLLPRQAAWLDDFRAEILPFPAGRYSDQVDAFSQALHHAFTARRGECMVGIIGIDGVIDWSELRPNRNTSCHSRDARAALVRSPEFRYTIAVNPLDRTSSGFLQSSADAGCPSLGTPECAASRRATCQVESGLVDDSDSDR
jgi:hypothetical protein